MSDEEIRYEVRDRVAWITLNRPERRNALTRRMMTIDLPAVWERFKEDDEAFVGVITGAGEQAFCAGMDVKEASDRYAEDAQRDAEVERLPVRVSPRMNEVWKPVIAAVNGVCTGVAMQLVADCDIIVASTDAYFSDARTSVGLVAALGSVEMSRAMPLHESLRLMLMGRHGRLTAERAYQFGFVNELAPPDELEAKVSEVAHAVMLNAPRAVRVTKMAIWQGLDRGLEEGKLHARALADANPTAEDVREGTRAFVEKRAAEWKLR